MKIQESLENYLETILILSRDGKVRAIDIAKHLNFSRPSVSVALKNLKEKNLIEVDNNDGITLTVAGLEIASRTYLKHQFYCEMLSFVGVDYQVAQDDACRLEHYLSDESFTKLKAYFDRHMN